MLILIPRNLVLASCLLKASAATTPVNGLRRLRDRVQVIDVGSDVDASAFGDADGGRIVNYEKEIASEFLDRQLDEIMSMSMPTEEVTRNEPDENPSDANGSIPIEDSNAGDTPEFDVIAPVTPAPIITVPVTPAPVTSTPITPAPVTPALVTSAPVTPITSTPITLAPVTPAPVTPITPAPVTPVTLAPVTSAPITSAPVSPAPVTSAPVSPAPVTSAPVSPAPATSTPTASPTEAHSKCGMTEETRAREILSILSTVSDVALLSDSNTSQYGATNWLINIDEAFLCPLTDSNSADRITQRYVAALLYFQLDGTNWLNCNPNGGGCIFDTQNGISTRFLSKDHECRWYGITCESTMNQISIEEHHPITMIQLESDGLAGDLPVELFELTSIQKLLMEGNDITGPLPAAIGQLASLSAIDLDNNLMSGSIPEVLFDLANITAIDLNDNSFSGTLSSSVANLERLVVIQLENNNFSGAVPEASIAALQNLVTLQVDGNAFTGSLQEICNIRPERRKENNLYLRFLSADCKDEDSPEVACDCCRCL